jgi:hypothetical protein
LTWLTIGMLTLLGALYLAGALLESARWSWWVSLLPTAYVVGMLVTLWRDERTPYAPGANDNAASVAVALDLAARLAARPLQHLEAQLAFTGAEETDHAGLYTLLRRGGTALRQAHFVGLEGLGGGEIVYLTRGGLCFHYRPSTELLREAEADLVTVSALRAEGPGHLSAPGRAYRSRPRETSCTLSGTGTS